MESWARVIREWINCLGIAQTPIVDLRDLQDCALYRKIISQLSSENGVVREASETLDDRELVSNFIKDKYPDFADSDECGNCFPEELHTASLLLVLCSQHAAFQRPMCVGLSQETQVHVKKFLELVLPYGNSVTREVMEVALVEVGDSAPNLQPSTPVVRPLREFFNSPAARSVSTQRYDRNRELNRLKAQLEMEKFEKADLREDILIQEEKIQHLQKKLQDKCNELKSLRDERFRPPTPQSCRKNRRASDDEERFKREIYSLETCNDSLRNNVEMLQDELEELKRKSDSKDKMNRTLKEKFEQHERSLEALCAQLEVKNQELLDLRMNNEELREHIREIQKSPLAEQSFEMEPITRARSPLNCSEALSSIIDIQLQDAKKESSMLQNQLDATSKRLELALRECEDIRIKNNALQESAKQLEKVSRELSSTQEQLNVHIETVNELRVEKFNLIEDVRRVKDNLTSKENLLEVAQTRKRDLEAQLEACTSRNHVLEDNLQKETAGKLACEERISIVEGELKNLVLKLETAEKLLEQSEEEKRNLKSALQAEVEKLEATERNLSSERTIGEDLRSVIERCEQQIGELTNLLENSEQRLLEVDADRVHVLSQLEKSRDRSSDLEGQLESERGKACDLESKITLGEQLLGDLKLSLEESKQKLLDSDEEKRNLEKSLLQTRDQLKDSERESQLLRERMDVSEKELSIEKERGEALRTDLRVCQQCLEASQTALGDKEQRIEELLSTITQLESSTQVLQKEIMSQADCLVRERATVEELHSAVDLSKQEAEDLERRLENSTSEIKNLRSESAKLKESLVCSETSCEELEKRIVHQERTIEALKESSEEVRREAKALSEESLEKSSRIEELELRLRESQERESRKSSALNEVEKKIEELMELREEVESQLKQKQDQLRALESERSDLEERVSNLLLGEAEFKKKIEKDSRDILDLEDRLRKHMQENKSLEESNCELQEEKSKTERELTREKQRFAALESQKTILEEELKVSNQCVADLKIFTERIERDLKERSVELEEQLTANTDLKKCNSELNDVRIKLESTVSNLEEELKVVRVEKCNIEEQLVSEKNSSADLKQRLEGIQSELLERSSALQEEQQTTSTLAKINSELEDLKNQAEKKITQLELNIEETEVEKKNTHLKLQSVLESESALKLQLERLSGDLEASQQSEEQLKKLICSYEEQIQELHNLKKKLESDLLEEKLQLKELQGEKELLEEEVALYGRSNQDLGEKLVQQKSQIEKLEEELKGEKIVSQNLNQSHRELQDEKEQLDLRLEELVDQSRSLETQKKSLEDELANSIQSKADLHLEMENLRSQLRISHEELENLKGIKEKLTQEATEASKKIDKLKIYESENQTSKIELEKSNLQVKVLQDQLKDLERVAKEFQEETQKSEATAESLKKRLLSAEKISEGLKLEDRLKEEALTVVKSKLEKLMKEKIDSQLRMKEIIVNLQEVRAGQDAVLEAQAKNLKEKTQQLEDIEKELDTLRETLKSQVDKTEVERAAKLELELQTHKLKEEKQLQSVLVEELRSAVEIEKLELQKTTERSSELEKRLLRVTEVSQELRKEILSIRKVLGEAGCEMSQQDETIPDSTSPEVPEVEKAEVLVGEVLSEVKDVRRAASSLQERNERLKKEVSEITDVSESLKVELSALWDCVERACPELAPRHEEILQPGASEKSRRASEVFRTVKLFANEAKTIRRAVSILSEANETLKEHLDGEKEEARRSKSDLEERISSLESEKSLRNDYIEIFIAKTKDLQESLSSAVENRDEVDKRLKKVILRWKTLGEEAKSLLSAGSSACDELKHLQLKRNELDEFLSQVGDLHSGGLNSLLKIVSGVFLWCKERLRSLKEAQPTSLEQIESERELEAEKTRVESEIEKIFEVRKEVESAEERIEGFESLLRAYEVSLRSGVIKRPASAEEKLQTQVEKLEKERTELKEKLDAMRVRNIKMEKNMDDLRSENKKLKSDSTGEDSEEAERLKESVEKLEKEIGRLLKENEELSAKKEPEDFEAKLKEVHNEYGQKLEKIKQKMKTAYNEQIAKLNQEQEKAVKEKMGALKAQMEKQCRKYTEDIDKYKKHITDLSSRYWDVGEKLLAETQEKQAALRKLDELKGAREKRCEVASEENQQVAVAQSRLKTASLDRRDFAADRLTRESTSKAGYRAVEVIEEETTTYSTRRHSVKSIQAMGNAFNAEDEEGELFDSVYLTDLKEGRCAPVGPDFDRLSELRIRNSMCRPHLKSSYAVETHFQPITLNEDDIKNGVTADDVFNDSLSQSLLPGQKPKKRDRTQTSYKRPGPPTPSKNGGRLSLQGNELKSPTNRVLRERNVERRTTATPRGLKHLFGTSISKRQDENTTGTPKARRLSNIFRKQRTERN